MIFYGLVLYWLFGSLFVCRVQYDQFGHIKLGEIILLSLFFSWFWPAGAFEKLIEFLANSDLFNKVMFQKKD